MAEFTQGHALVVGVGNYKDTAYSVPITYNDAKGVYDALINPAVCAYPPNHVTFLFNENATRANILAALKTIAGRVEKGDSVFIFLAGHGAPADDGTWHFATHETEFASIKSIKSGNALRQTELLDALRAIAAQKILLLINACFSGLVAPALAPSTPVPPTLGTPPPDELSSAILRTGEGRVIITASRGNQYSMFDIGAPRTFFGDALVQGLNGNGVSNKNGYIGLFELYEWLYKRAQQGASKYQAVQEPVLTILQGVGPFPVALYKGSTPGNLADAGLMTLPPPNTAANVVTIGAGATVSNITGSNNTVTQNSNNQNISGSNVVNIGAGANVSQAAAGTNIQQTITYSTSVGDLATLFQSVYQKVDARPDDPKVTKKEIKDVVQDIENEVSKGEDANANRVKRWLEDLQDIAPDILQVTAAALLNPIAGVAKAIELVAKKVQAAN